MHIFIRTLLFLLVFSTVSTAYAQKNAPPSGQFGLGVEVSSSGSPGGISGTYAINRNMQVGTYFSLGIASANGVSATTFGLMPFFRYQFESVVSPYLQGGFSIFSQGGSSVSGMFVGGGLAYYFAQTFAVHADVDVLTIAFSPSATFFGWAYTRTGVMWFF